MPSKPERKQFVAARNFRHAGKLYRKGDPVTILRTIDLLSRRGDKWITRAPKPPADTPADEPQPNPLGGDENGS